MKKGLVITVAFIVFLLVLFYAAFLANPPTPEHSEHAALSWRSMT